MPVSDAAAESGRAKRTITGVTARRILDCRGFPTVQVDVWVGDVLGRADVPAGRSTGSREAVELRDGGARYRGADVESAIRSVREVIAPKLAGLRRDRPGRP